MNMPSDATEIVRKIQLRRCGMRTAPSDSGSEIVAASRGSLALEDAEIFDRMFRAKNGDEIRRLWDGDSSANDGDKSAADLALCNHLMFYTGNDTTQADRLFRRSHLCRDKWDRLMRSGDSETYGQRTLAMAVQKNVYGSRNANPGQPPQVTTGTSTCTDDAAPPDPDEPDPRSPCDPGSFPEHLLQVPGLVGEIVEYTLATAHRRAPTLALAGGLALMGTIAGRKVRSEGNTRTNIYLLAVCPSGGGKDRPREVNKEILQAADATKFLGGEGIASHAGLISATEKQPAILFQIDEFGRMLRIMSDERKSPHLYAIGTKLMQLFSCAGTFYAGDNYSDTERRTIIQQPNACLLGTSVPRSLYESLTVESITDGFLSRMLIFEDAGLEPKQRPAPAVLPESIASTVAWWVHDPSWGNLHHVNPSPLTIPENDDARCVFDTFDAEAEDLRRTLGDPYGTLWSRAAEKAVKLALLYACSRDHKNLLIDADAMTWACDLSRYLTARMAYLARQWISDGTYDATRKRVLRIIEAAGSDGIARRDLTRRLQSIRAKDRDEIILAILEAGDVRLEKRGTSGRTREVFVFNRASS